MLQNVQCRVGKLKWDDRPRVTVLSVLLVTSATLATAANAITKGTSAGREVAVLAYLPSWRYEGANWDEIMSHLSHLLLFSLEPRPDGSIAGLDRLPRPELLVSVKTGPGVER